MNRTPVADWQQLSALYELADTLDPESLQGWLAQLRQQAHPLLPQLEQMLIARQQVQCNGFLGALPRLPEPPAPAASRPIEWQAGTRIGPYRLLRKIGIGGMAEVWLAQRDDGAFQRQVAIKLLFRHQGSDQRDSFAQRFDRERDILASLDHPHIAGLHDAGVTANGQPWLALEYVEGQTFTTWCDARCLTIEARVRLFRQVLLAVQHAHANLVIHRDLKPGNILVTAQGDVRLLDFGIAKLMEPEGAALPETELTRLAGRPMTPQYASPEQLMGHPLTTACDVYSLGVVLYELLCGERPYELKVESAAQLEQAILDTEPRAPSRRALSEPIAMARATTGPMLRKQLASDLDAIALRALAKQPAQRYGSVEALRADLDRWLDGEPVEARTPSTVYRVGKFVRRHTLSVSLGVGAVVSLVGVAAVAVVMGLQAREDSARAVAARDFMLNIFQRANQEKSRGADITARDLLDAGRKDVLTRLVGQPRLQAELLRGIAKVQTDMGEYATADATFAELSRIYLALGLRHEAAQTLVDHAENAVHLGNPSLALSLLIKSREAYGDWLNAPELDARMSEIEGWIVLSQRQPERARMLLEAGLKRATARLGHDHLRTFKLGETLFQALSDQGDYVGALALHDALVRVSSHVAGVELTELAELEVGLVELTYGAGHFRQALLAAENALPKCAAAHGADDQYCRILQLKRVRILQRLGYFDRAHEQDRLVAELASDATSPVIQTRALLLQFQMLRPALQIDESQLLFERVRALGLSGPEVTLGEDFKVAALLAISESRLRAGRPTQAQHWADAAMARVSSGAGKNAGSVQSASAHLMRGVALVQLGKLEDGLIMLVRAQSMFGRTLGPEHPLTQLYAMNNAVALLKLGRWQDAAALVSVADPILRDAFGADAPLHGQVTALRKRIEQAGSPVEPPPPRTSSSEEGAPSRPENVLFFG